MAGNTATDIGRRIKELREGKKLRQADLAEKVTVKRETVNQWENGTRQIKGEDIAALADALDTTTDYILRGIASEHVDIARYTHLSDKAIERLHRLGSTGPVAKGYRIAITDMLSELIESDGFYEMFSGMGFYFIYGGLLPPHAYTSDVGELTEEEWRKFHDWANAHGQEILPRNSIKDYYLQRAADALKIICEQIAAKEKEAATNG